MLYLNRKPGEVIYVQKDGSDEVLTIVVTKIDYEKRVVTLGFENETKEFNVLRKEVKERNEGKELPNPFYNDRIPAYWLAKRKAATQQNDNATPSTEAYVDELVKALQDES